MFDRICIEKGGVVKCERRAGSGDFAGEKRRGRQFMAVNCVRIVIITSGVALIMVKVHE